MPSLANLRPVLSGLALAFAVLAAWKGIALIVPVLNQVATIRGDALTFAGIAIALALVNRGP